MKLQETKKKARRKFWFGLPGMIVFGFTTFIALLKSFHVSLKDQGSINGSLSESIGDLINFISRETDYLTIFWRDIWPTLPVINPYYLLQDSNYYFFALVGFTMFFYLQLQDSFWLKAKIRKKIKKIFVQHGINNRNNL